MSLRAQMRLEINNKKKRNAIYFMMERQIIAPYHTLLDYKVQFVLM